MDQKPLVHSYGVATKVHEKGPHLRVVTFNVYLAPDPQAVADAILANPNLRTADIFMLQEIEGHEEEQKLRTQVIADALEMHFVYAPARRLERALGTHGLAILSRFPITEAETIKLPFLRLGWRSRDRIALRADLDVSGTPLTVVNVHLDTRLNPDERIRQLKPVMDRALEHPEVNVVVGGDFNTIPLGFFRRAFPVSRRDQRRALDEYFLRQGFTGHVGEVDRTTRHGFFSMKLDTIYTRGIDLIGYGVEEGVTVSDHLPLWADIVL
jgi:endonuclease/exonuclease/phosphatase family metal-dependent hydrolase